MQSPDGNDNAAAALPGHQSGSGGVGPAGSDNVAADSSESQPQQQASQPQLQPKAFGWNIRSLAEVDPERLLPGRVYRCSQVFK